MRELYILLLPYLSAISGVTCVQPFQNAKTPEPPYATVDIQSTQATGYITTGRDDSESTETKQRTFSFTVDVNIYGRANKRMEAMDIAQTLLDGLEDHRRRTIALGDVMAFQDVISSPQDITGLIANQNQPRVNLAMRWHTARSITYDIDIVDTIEINDAAPFYTALTP